MNIAIHNIHELPNLFGIGIHDYVLELLRNGAVKYLYFDVKPNRGILRLIHNSWINRGAVKFKDIPWDKIELVFSSETLCAKCDVLLNFNSHLGRSQFTPSLKKFNGLKIFHVTDYFWNQPGSELNELLLKYGVSHLFGYAAHDRYCGYFNKTFSHFSGKVWGVPFGFSPRFSSKAEFSDRISKVVALGSVNPIRDLSAPIYNYREPADYFSDEIWMHKFRRILVHNKSALTGEMDSMLPEYPQIKDFRYDLPGKFNEYKMFTACESVYFFPPAKYFEGSACGCVCVCADHSCNRDYGFTDGVNCIMYPPYDVTSFRDKVIYYQQHTKELKAISNNAISFSHKYFTHKMVAEIVALYTSMIYSNPGGTAPLLRDCLPKIPVSGNL